MTLLLKSILHVNNMSGSSEDSKHVSLRVIVLRNP